MESFNFNELPEVIRLLFEKVEQIELMILNLQPADQNENELLNVAEASEFLKISVAALYTKVSRKEIAHSKAGKRLYFSKADLKEYINQGKRRTLTEIQKESEERFGRSRRNNRY